MTPLQRINRDLEKWLLLVFYVMLVITMAIEVMRRELMAYSSVWGEEVVRYAFIYLAWIGAAAAVKERAHIRIDVIMHYLAPRPKALIYMLGDVVMFIVALYAFRYSLENVLLAFDKGSVLVGLQVSRVWVLAAVPVGFTLVIFRLLQSFWRDLISLRDGTPVFEGDTLFD